MKPRGIEDMRDQEVLRAHKELAAYFKGQRTEREARAALKILRRFVKDRERLDPAKRRPLPGLESPGPEAVAREKKKSAPRSKARRRSAPPRTAKPVPASDPPGPESGDS